MVVGTATEAVRGSREMEPQAPVYEAGWSPSDSASGLEHQKPLSKYMAFHLAFFLGHIRVIVLFFF